MLAKLRSCPDIVFAVALYARQFTGTLPLCVATQENALVGMHPHLG